MAYDRNYVPQMVRGCRRSGTRHRLGRTHAASLEVRAVDGRSWRFQLLDIGTGGVCFALDDPEPLIEQGSQLDHAVVHVGETRIEGTLTLAHATEEFAAGTICGARFEPATEIDRSALAKLITSLGG